MTDRVKNSTDSRYSRYVQGGLTDRYANRLGWWEPRNFTFDDDDIRFIISKNTEARPDLISFEAYGKAMFYWVVLQYNNIVDVEEELKAGMEIRLPKYSRLMLSIMNKKVGGNIVTD